MRTTRRSLLLGSAALAASAIAAPAFAQAATGAVTLVRHETELYVRTAWRADSSFHQVRRFLFGRPAGPATSQCIDDAGLSLIPASTPADQTFAAFDLGRTVLSADADQAAPAVFNDEYIGANHGLAGWQINHRAHGLTNADVGSVWSDGHFEFVLVQILDADHVALAMRATGDDEKWVRPMVGPQARLSRISGATRSGRLSLNGIGPGLTFRNLHPLLQAYEQEVLADGVRPVPMGVSTCDHLVLSERYRIPNIKALLDRLVSLVDTGAEPSLNDPAIPSQAGVEVSYRLDWTGGVEGRYAFTALQASRMGAGSYLGGMQIQRPLFPAETTFTDPAPTDWTRTVFAFGATTVYDLGGAPQPGDFTQGLDITPQPQAAFYSVRADGWGSAADGGARQAPDRFVQLVSRSGAPQHGVVFGYDHVHVDGTPERRRALTDVACTVSTVDKLYPQFRNARAGDLAAGDTHEVGFFYGHYAPTSPEWVAELLAPAGDATRLYLQRRAGVPLRAWIPCDDRLIGRNVLADRRSEGVEVLSTVVTAQGIEVSFPAIAASLDLRLASA